MAIRSSQFAYQPVETGIQMERDRLLIHLTPAPPNSVPIVEIRCKLSAVKQVTSRRLLTVSHMEVSMPCFRSALATLAVSLFFAVILLASDPPNFGGSWEMDTAKSQVLDGRVIVLNIESVQKKLKVVELVRDKTGKELSYQFVCETSGGQCDFDEGGHKSKVSLWYNGPALVLLK